MHDVKMILSNILCVAKFFYGNYIRIIHATFDIVHRRLNLPERAPGVIQLATQSSQSTAVASLTVLRQNVRYLEMITRTHG